MTVDFDSKLISIPCPQCGEKFNESIGRLKTNPKLVCSSCGQIIAINADELVKGLDAANKSIEDFDRRIRDAFKG